MDVASRRIGNAVAGVSAVAVAAVTMYFYVHMKQPQIFLDYAALIFSGLTTGIVTFFVVWGHFQEDPQPGKPE